MNASAAGALDRLLASPAGGGPERGRGETLALMARAGSDAAVRAWLGDLARLLHRDAPPELAEYERLALLGACAGFLERTLSPYAPEHVEIIPPLLDEIRAVYGQLQALGGGYDRDEFRYRAFHYGLHKACYLDWRLYLSNTCY
jgi:hypothetical protein